MVLLHPALQGVWKTHTIHSHLSPGRFCEHSVRDAGRSKHSCDCLQRTSQVPSHRVDEVPLRLGRRSSYVVCSHLCLVKLPLEHKKGTCNAKDGIKIFYGALGTLTCHGGIDAISKEAFPLLSGIGLCTRVRHPGLPQLGAQSHRF